MRFNKQELVTLATQPSTKFEKEGILYIRERQEGFFRKSESKYNINMACNTGGKCIRSIMLFRHEVVKKYINVFTLRHI